MGKRYFGEQTTSVGGKGKDISDSDLINVGTEAGLKKSFCEECIREIRNKMKMPDEYLS